ncbi:MAG TPA: fumarylacetoacetate hydrolase family protein [Thermomicrobiales bacterium]|nr:fumarylacetoacetate hydrolase family protein [Thermomicrobiales bacterium]
MALAYVRPRESTFDAKVLAWVDLASQRVFALDGTLAGLLRLSPDERSRQINALRQQADANLALDEVAFLAPVDEQEVWAAGVTYERSRDARMEESSVDDVYARVYDAERPEIFFKAPAWRCVGDFQPVAIRHDSTWDVPEPELALVIDSEGTIAGYTVGNDVSSRSIEGENPLYLPQAKMFSGSCALGPWIVLANELHDPLALDIRLRIERDGQPHWSGQTSTRSFHRSLDQLVECLYSALDFPAGAVLMTGTGIVPPSEFTLESGDTVSIEIDGIGTLTNHVYRLPERSANG